MIEVTATDLPRVMHCIGSIFMSASLPPDTDRDARDEGNAAHWLSKELFDGREVRVGDKAYNGYVITETMMDHMQEYVARLDCGAMEINTSWSGGTVGDNYTAFDVRARADHIMMRNEVEMVNAGYGNVAEIDHWHLMVDDLKYGWRVVEPEANWTLIAHAIGYCIAHGVKPERITLRIHQPRPYHPLGPVRSWVITYEQLLEYHAQIVARLSNPTADLHTRYDICAKCPAMPTCPAARQAGMNAVDVATLAYDDTLSNNVLAYELEMLTIAEATITNRKTALEELITYRIAKGGEVFEDYALKPRYANTKWKTGFTGKFLSMVTGRDLIKDAVVTPAAAKRLGVPDSILADLTERPMIGAKLERITADKAARRWFNDGAEK